MVSDHSEQLDTDPTNPRSVPGPFGSRSEILFPDYREPGWLTAPSDGEYRQVTVPRVLDVDLPIMLFSPAGLDDGEPAPLIVAQDGPDLAERGRLTQWAAATSRPTRLALLEPPNGYRNRWYAAAPDYADHVAKDVIPALRELCNVSSTIGLGASLGAVATMMVHRRHKKSLDAMALQSGSFFRPRIDKQESGWPEFRQVTAAVSEWTKHKGHRPIPTLITVGGVEENRSNNEKMAKALRRQGYPVTLQIVPDAHNVIAWRDSWHPGLDQLIAPLK